MSVGIWPRSKQFWNNKERRRLLQWRRLPVKVPKGHSRWASPSCERNRLQKSIKASRDVECGAGEDYRDKSSGIGKRKKRWYKKALSSAKRRLSVFNNDLVQEQLQWPLKKRRRKSTKTKAEIRTKSWTFWKSLYCIAKGRRCWIQKSMEECIQTSEKQLRNKGGCDWEWKCWEPNPTAQAQHIPNKNLKDLPGVEEGGCYWYYQHGTNLRNCSMIIK